MKIKHAKALRSIAKIVLLLCFLSLLGLGIFFTYKSLKYKPYKVRVSNVTDSAFTVSWVTDEPMVGVVYYSEKDSFLPGPLSWIGKSKAVDDRDVSNAQTECVSKFNKQASKNKDDNFTVDIEGYDCNNVKVVKRGRYYTHHVTVQNLDAEKEYYFRVGDGYISYSKGKTEGVEYVFREVPEISSFQQKTTSVITDVEAPNPAYGTSYNIYYRSDGSMAEKKNFDSIIFLKPYKEEKQLPTLSSITNSAGGWAIDLANIRDENGVSVSLEGVSLEFIPQVENTIPGATGATKFEEILFPLRLLGNNIEDLKKGVEVQEEDKELGTVLKKLANGVIAYDDYDDAVFCYPNNGCTGKTFTKVNGGCPPGWQEKQLTSCNSDNPPKSADPPAVTYKNCCNKGSASCYCIRDTKCSSGRVEYSGTLAEAKAICEASLSAVSKTCYYCDSDNILKSVKKASCEQGESPSPISCSKRCTGDGIEARSPVRGGCGGNTNTNYCYIPLYHNGELCEYQKTTSANCGMVACGDADAVAIGGDMSGGGKWDGKGECNHGGGCICEVGENAAFKGECKKTELCYYPKACNTGVPQTEGTCEMFGGSLSMIACNNALTVDDSDKEDEAGEPETIEECAFISNGECRRLTGAVNCGHLSKDRTLFYESYDACTSDINSKSCWIVSTDPYSTKSCEPSTISKGSNECEENNVYDTKLECLNKGVGNQSATLCWYQAKPSDSTCRSLTNISSCYLGKTLRENVRSTANECYEAFIKSSDSKLEEGTKCEENNCLCHPSSGYISTISNGQCCGDKWIYFVTYDDGTPLKGECHTSSGGIFCSKDECENSRQSALALKLNKFRKGLEGSEDLYVGVDGQVCVTTCKICRNYHLKPLHKVDSGEYYLQELKECGEELKGITITVPGPDSSLQRGNDFIIRSYAASEDASSAGIYYFPESGVYKVTTSDGASAFVLGGEGNSYFLYYDRNGEEGYQSPEDPQNPKENEDLIATDSFTEIAVSKIIDTYQVSVKEGINIISLDFLPTINGLDGINLGNFLKLVNNYEKDIISRISYFNGGAWAGGVSYDFSTGETRGYGEDLLSFGTGYLLVATRDGTISIPGKKVQSPVPLSLSSGWNLVGVHGYDTQYTANSLINSINTIQGLKSNNVTYWPTSKGMYQGYQLSEGQAYGQDFSISKDLGYFVRISEFNASDDSCKSIIWNPGGDLNGECGSSN